MLFRRLSKHVKDQNWFAVALDFFIVVFGVFIGMQVANWNEARNANDREYAYLVELRAEIAANNVISGEVLELAGITIAAGEKSLEFLKEDMPCTRECWRLLVDFFHASQVAVAPLSLSVFEEMQRQGLPRSKPVKLAMSTYSLGAGSRAAITQDLPQYRERIRGLIPVGAQRALWRDCHSNVKGRERYITDCPAGIREDDASAILNIIRNDPELHRHLTFWIGHNIMDKNSNSNQIEMGNSVLKAINTELERRQ